MKKLLLLLLFTTPAYATGLHPQPTDIQIQGQAQGQVANGGNSSTVVQGDDVSFPKIANSAIAPSVNSNVICPMVSPASKAGSLWFISTSGTTGTTVNGICVAYHQKNDALVHQIACDESSSYRTSAKKLGIKCK